MAEAPNMISKARFTIQLEQQGRCTALLQCLCCYEAVHHMTLDRL